MSLAQTRKNWSKIVKPYAIADHKKSWFQFISTLLGFIIFWTLAYQALAVSYWLTLFCCLFTLGFSVRLYIVLHDCGHGSYFKTKNLRDIVGTICGILTLTPYAQWVKAHGIHHATSGNIEKKGIGDMLTYSIEEYEKLNWFDQLYYHCYRNPIFTFFLGPIYIFIIDYRKSTKIDGPIEKKSIYITNFALALILLLFHLTIGLKAFLLIHIPITIMACGLGSWLFYVQHQYENPYWEKDENWDFYDAAMIGSSYYKLPKVLQYFSGNIGFHHIHHLSHAIPNYNLEKCMNENTLFQTPKTFTLLESFKYAFLNIYDEKMKELISFKEYRKRRRAIEAFNQEKNKQYYADKSFVSDIGK